MPDAFTSHPRKRQASTLAGTLAIQVVATANVLAFPVLVPVIPEATTAQVGVFVMVLYIGAMIAAVFSGTLIGRVGPVRASQLALAAQASGLSCIALAGTSVSGPTLSVLVHLLGAALCGIG